MKKYRLKQWYPSLPAELKVGDIVEFNGVDSIRLEIREKYEFTEYWWEFNGLELECTQYWELIEEKEPLFITDDGVEVFDRNTIVYIVRNDTLAKIKINADYFSKYGFEHKVFLLESSADEYIWRNKRVFSYNDIEEFQSGGEGVFYDIKAIAKRRNKQ